MRYRLPYEGVMECEADSLEEAERKFNCHDVDTESWAFSFDNIEEAEE